MDIVFPFALCIVAISIVFCIIDLRLKKNNKISNDVNAISLLILLGASYDLFSLLSIVSRNSELFLFLTYYIFYPLYLIFCFTFPVKIKTHLLVQFFIFLSLSLLSIFVDYSKIRLFVMDNLVIPIFIIQMIAIIVTGYKIINNNKSKLIINIILYLLLGLLSMQSIALLSIYQYIHLEMSIWFKFKIFFSIYIALMRIIYIIYVSKRIKP